ncbi:hypothetical protein ACFLEY_22340 [Bradyrhizobium sp. YCK136]|uniref:hypothetical protein n=1 Tax=Bradyrhizobium sp. YCK136 TaxID=3351346 RepID=UPI0037C711A1
MKYAKGEWVQSARVGNAPKFVGQVMGHSQGQYIIRDADRVRWLRFEEELSPAPKKAA